MYARLRRFAGLAPARLEQTVREFEQGELPNLEQQPGFKGVLVLADRGEGKAAAMTLWEGLDDPTASEKIADRARQAAVASARSRRRADRRPMRGVLQK